MATVRQYFDTDFPYTVKLHCHFALDDLDIEARHLCDFSGFMSFLALYVSTEGRTLSYFVNIIKNIQYGSTQLVFDGGIILPNGWEFPGELQVRNHPDFQINARFHGAQRWVSWKDLSMSKRVFIYSESDLTDDEILKLEAEGLALGHDVQFRSGRHVIERSRFQRPVAFVSHDSRDADAARRIAIGLQKMRCSVWYDEFSLRAGDNLRDSIEKGLKECHKCIVVLSTHFFSNGGWTKKEFDSIFTRDILEETNLVLPVWFEVTKKEVYDYSPSLLNVKGLDWARLGEDEVIRQLSLSILAPHPAETKI
jgi:TIR domain